MVDFPDKQFDRGVPEMKAIAAAAAVAALLAPAASAATYTLDFTGSGFIPDTFADNAEADLSYRAIAAGSFGNVATLGTVSFWGTGYGDLDGAAWGNPNPSIGEIRIRAVDPTMAISLDSFDLGGWSADERAEWRVFDLAWTLVATGSGIAPNFVRLSVGASGKATGGLILQWGADAWDVGIENVRYTVGPADDPSPIPLPASLPLALAGVAALAALRRNRRG